MSGPDLLDDVLSPPRRVAYVPLVREALGVEHDHATRIVEAFDSFVAEPLEANLRKLTGLSLSKRNPMIYTSRGVTTVDEWVEQVLADKETSAIENHLGTFLEEVARILSGGFKPASGVDLQLERPDRVVELYAIQMSPNTKNAGGRRADVEALKRAARPLRAARRSVDLYIAVLGGRRASGALRAEPEITVLGSDEFWTRVTGIADFRARLLKASVALAPLVKKRSSDEVARIRGEARRAYGAPGGQLDLDAVAFPRSARTSLGGRVK